MRDVVNRSNQQARRRRSDGINPANEEITGRASIPAPIEVPETRRMPPIKRFILILKMKKSGLIHSR
jgi:hypothetical protein